MNIYHITREKHRHDVLPGLTGLAQISGRNTLQWEERFEYDLEYIKNISFKNDMKIIFKTIKKVLKKDNIVIRGTSKTKDFNIYRGEQNEFNGR